MRAKVEIFQGTIWANWDHNAPGFLEYLGGADAYLKTSFVDADGSDDGAEILGSPMKWRIGMNWKVPMPDHDITHGWTTHRSLAFALGVGPSGAPVERTAEGGYVGRRGRAPMMQVSFPEGHTTAVEVPTGRHDNEPWPDKGQYDDWPVIREYLRDKWEARKARLGVLAGLEEGPHIFPNLGFFGRVIRVLHPESPTSTEMWSYFLVDRAAPQEVKDAVARYYEHWYGPGGMTQKDDMENWYVLTRWTKGHMTRKMRLNNQLGMGEPVLDGPSTFGLPGLWAPNYSDENTRRYYQRWAEMMDARTWDELRVR
jgi:phenylpropionate dioxygenase-like ring-hydroxylating dioxygenase large terminal subunit